MKIEGEYYFKFVKKKPQILFQHIDIPVNPVHQVDKPVILFVPVQNKKLLWDTADTDLYHKTLETLLEQNFSFWNQPECIQTLTLGYMHSTLSKLQKLLFHTGQYL